MNFLQLCQRLRLECGASGTGPVTTANQKGELLRIVTWIQNAWIEIQSKHQDWEWLRRPINGMTMVDGISIPVGFPTVQAQATYSPQQIGISDFGMWKRDSFRNYNTAAGITSEIFMEFIHYEMWRDNFQYGALRESYSQPDQFSITPDKSLGLGPVPLVGYTVIGDYFQCPQDLVNDNDIPAMPSQHHMAIVYRALQDYGYYEENPGVVQRATAQLRPIMTRLENDRIPDVQVPGCLA